MVLTDEFDLLLITNLNDRRNVDLMGDLINFKRPLKTKTHEHLSYYTFKFTKDEYNDNVDLISELNYTNLEWSIKVNIKYDPSIELNCIKMIKDYLKLKSGLIVDVSTYRFIFDGFRIITFVPFLEKNLDLIMMPLDLIEYHRSNLLLNLYKDYRSISHQPFDENNSNLIDEEDENNIELRDPFESRLKTYKITDIDLTISKYEHKIDSLFESADEINNLININRVNIRPPTRLIERNVEQVITELGMLSTMNLINFSVSLVNNELISSNITKRSILKLVDLINLGEIPEEINPPHNLHVTNVPGEIYFDSNEVFVRLSNTESITGQIELKYICKLASDKHLNLVSELWFNGKFLSDWGKFIYLLTDKISMVEYIPTETLLLAESDDNDLMILQNL